jgi:hypothetical protein
MTVRFYYVEGYSVEDGWVRLGNHHATREQAQATIDHGLTAMPAWRIVEETTTVRHFLTAKASVRQGQAVGRG